MLSHVPPTSVFFSNSVIEMVAPNLFCNCTAAQMPETLFLCKFSFSEFSDSQIKTNFTFTDPAPIIPISYRAMSTIQVHIFTETENVLNVALYPTHIFNVISKFDHWMRFSFSNKNNFTRSFRPSCKLEKTCCDFLSVTFEFV